MATASTPAWLLWAGPLAAIVCLGSIGLTQSPLVLAILLIVAGLGIAAYHPEAAALAGSCAPENRSRAMSIFIMGGFLGQATGPIYSGNLVDALGLSRHDLEHSRRLARRGAARAARTQDARSAASRSIAAAVTLHDALRGRVAALLAGAGRSARCGSLPPAACPCLISYLLEHARRERRARPAMCNRRSCWASASAAWPVPRSFAITTNA